MEEMHFAAAIGLDVIITDHHTPGEQTPCAYAVLNPKLPGSRYPFRSLCGAGVAYKLASALEASMPGRMDLDRLLKIAAIATVADMVPLHGENRWIVWAGLQAMDREEKGPLRSLLRKVGVRGSVQATDISFRVAPRLNAPGRLGDPDPAIALLDDPTPQEAGRLIDIMDGMNTVRQMIERDLSERLEDQVRAILAKDLPSFVLLAGRNWHRGILGIMACKMLRRLNRPVAVLSYGQTEAHGSIRSLPGVDLMKALGQLSSLLTSFGGHTEAAGICLPITNIPQFKMRMNELLHQDLSTHQEFAGPSVDAELAWSAIDDELFRTIRRLAPHGMGNPQPVFLSRNLILESNPQMRGAWAHFEVSDGNLVRRCSCYLPLGFAQPIERFDSVDLLYSLTPFRESFQIQVLEMKPSAQE
jgi:single-stranded-DNA-specific exonuclease